MLLGAAQGMAAGLPSAAAARVDAATAAEILEQVRRSDLPGQYYWEFQLHALPRRGAERVYQGRGWGRRNEQGPIKRVELTDAAGKAIRFLIQNGERSAVWRWADGRTTQLGSGDLFAPLLPGVELTAFDLQMPFLFWANVTLMDVARVRGREAHVFVFRPPPEFAAQNPQIGAARVFVDAQLNAILQTELLDRNDRPLKRFSPQSLKTVGKQPFPKTVDFRNETTGDKARIEVAAVALDLNHADALFQPAALADEVRAPAAKLTRFD